MEELAMCRICLAEDVQLRLIANTHLQEIYESLTLLSLETKDSRPIQACYICCAELQNCHRLRKKCYRSEELFTQILRSGVLQPINVQEGRTQRLTVEHVVHLSIGNVLQNNTDDGTTEDHMQTIVVDHNTVVRDFTKDIKIEPQEKDDARPDNDILCSHLGDPLDVVKKELDDVETDPEDIPIEENEPIGAYQSSLSANNICPKIEKVEVEIMDINNPIAATGVPALKKHAETDSLLEPKNESKSIVIEGEGETYKSKNCFRLKDYLERNTSSKHNLTQQTYTHTVNKPYINEICKEKFSQKSQLTFDLRTNTSDKLFHCDTCNKCFTRKSYLAQHLTTHTDEKRFQCKTCNKCFSRKSYLTQHLTIHTAEKRFQCNICNKCFTRQSILSQHLTIHTAKKRFQCNTCNKCFTRKYILMQHLNLHTGEKLFQCDTCNKRFIRKCDLKRHQYTHTDEKRFQCDICTKCYTSKTNLRKHLTTHTGKERFHCNTCNESFKKKSDLTQHLYIHTLTRNGFIVPLTTNALQEN